MKDNSRPIIEVKDLVKVFRLPHDRSSSIKQTVLNWRKRGYEEFKVLNDISFSINEGEFFGIVGRNGSGKSTLLKILAGIYEPTKGKAEVRGTLTPFIELGVGFNPELTGRENIFLNGAILGLTTKEMEQKYDEIVEFAELERFMDQKLKNYSSGMQVRLAFSIAMQAHNGILLIDEVLAVGDAAFQRKCYNAFNDIKKSGKTVVLVTHDMGAVQEYCDRALMIEDGDIVAIGKPRELALRYQLANAADAGEEGMSLVKAKKLQRPKNPAIKIVDFKLTQNGKKKTHFSLHEDIVAELKIDVREPTAIQINTFFLRANDAYLAGVNSTFNLGDDFTPSKGEHILRCVIKAGQLVKGEYRAGAGIYTPGYYPELIDIIDKNYSTPMPSVTIVDASTYQDGEFYLQGVWSKER